jgi:TPP-dependent indolepyruvate ferredoxin oxidoreductase alpha subunit
LWSDINFELVEETLHKKSMVNATAVIVYDYQSLIKQRKERKKGKKWIQYQILRSKLSAFF